MDIYEELTQEHREVEDIFAQLQEKGPQKKLSAELQTQLASHLKAEEKVVYKRFMEEKSLRQTVLEGIEEHKPAERLLKELDKTDDKEVWKAKLKVLKEMVQHHVQEEEGTLFPEARKVIDEAEATRLRDAFEKQKQSIEKRAA